MASKKAIVMGSLLTLVVAVAILFLVFAIHKTLQPPRLSPTPHSTMRLTENKLKSTNPIIASSMPNSTTFSSATFISTNALTHNNDVEAHDRVLRFDEVENTLLARNAIQEVPVPSPQEVIEKFSSKCPTSKKYTKFEYKRRRPLQGQLAVMELFDLISHRTDLTVYTVKGSELPSIAQHQPISYSPRSLVDITKPFGGWKSFFLPLDRLNEMKEPQLIPPQPPMYVGVIRNGFSMRGDAITCSHAVLSTGACLWETASSHDIPSESSSENSRQYEAGFVLCDTWCKGYFHWTHEHLPRLALMYSTLKKHKNIKIVLPMEAGFQKQYMVDVFGFPSDQLLTNVNTPHSFRVLYYPMPMKCGNMFSNVQYLLRSIVFKQLNLSCAARPQQRNKVIVMAERKGNGRFPRNYNDLKKRLMAEFPDATYLFPYGKKIVEQIRMFNLADVIVGAHGANLANVMWSCPGTQLIEILSAKFGNLCYYSSASRVGVTHRIIFQNGTKDGPYVTDYEELKRHLEESLA
eukprot:PhF_6_TR14097/c0_g1_i1/m.22526